MTEQATLTPEEAILAVASAKCLTCEGRGLNTWIEDGDEVDGLCPDCLGADNEPTGARFHTLRVECNCPPRYHGAPDTCRNGCDHCGSRGWNPVAWTDEYTIRLALEAGGIEVTYSTGGGWWVTALRVANDYVLTIAALRAITAEAS